MLHKQSGICFQNMLKGIKTIIKLHNRFKVCTQVFIYLYFEFYQDLETTQLNLHGNFLKFSAFNEPSMYKALF